MCEHQSTLTDQHIAYYTPRLHGILPLHMRSVVDQNSIVWHMTALKICYLTILFAHKIGKKEISDIVSLYYLVQFLGSLQFLLLISINSGIVKQ